MTLDPQSGNVLLGEEIALTSIGDNSTSWRWEKDGVVMPGLNGVGPNALLNKQGAVAGDAGNYVAVFTNANGDTKSNPAVIRITVGP